MATATPPARQFFARPGVHILVLVPMALLFIGGIASLVGDPGNAAGGILTGLAVVLTLILYIPFVYRIRLRLGPAGVRASAPLCVLETTWDNVERLYLRGTHAGIVTRQALSGKGPERLRKSLLSINPYDEQENEWLSQDRYIPLRGFEHAVKSGAVERAVTAWAERAVTAPEPAPPPQRVPLKAWIIIGLCIAAALIVVSMGGVVEKRVSSIVLFAGLLAGTVGAFCHGLLLWRHKARFTGGMELLLSLILAVLAFAAVGGMIEAFRN